MNSLGSSLKFSSLNFCDELVNFSSNEFSLLSLVKRKEHSNLDFLFEFFLICLKDIFFYNFDSKG